MEDYFKTDKLSVGYNKNIIVGDINIELKKGELLTLIGPNGAGKSTVLKSIARQLSVISGTVYIDSKDLTLYSQKELAKTISVLSTNKVQAELMTAFDVTAMGRYPYTDMFGKLTPKDIECVWNALERVHAQDLSQMDFNTLSDGQRQRILLARAICQSPDILILDEPTAYLDIRYKTEFMDIIRDMAHKNSVTVIMSLHEIDLAMKVSDRILYLDDNSVDAFGTPEELLKSGAIERLYDIKTGSYDPLFGSIELKKPVGRPQIFIIAGCGHGIPYYRFFQKHDLAFATGLLFENDIDARVACSLSDNVILTKAFEDIPPCKIEDAKATLLKCESVLDAGTPIGSHNRANAELLSFARENNIPIYTDLSELKL